ncbi:hypothetical protein MSAN_02342700 [Mycena sanguinolenta]|uniref:Uncharacterized protein n=1 Tax=Mycena sanguinolenta TaxID=230812 RepID=A0A8H7CF38_9AGAR|nr:hypothetical protein MSAN_02342700 [Mycena sanguinolenta]
MASFTLPPEICGIICDELEQLGGNLAFLCRTSRNFFHQAQRILYRSVDLQGGGMRAVKLWARTMTRHAHLAERVRALKLELPDIQTIDISDIPKITRVYADILGGCWATIRSAYKKFECFESPGYDFWKTQTQIRVLSLPYSDNLPSFDNQLLDVIALGTEWLDDLPVRPLQRLETEFHEDFSPLAQYSQTLTTLSVWGHGMSTVSETLVAIADSVPALLRLSLAEHTKEPGPFHEVSPTSILRERFPRLEIFALQVRNVEHFLDMFNRYNMACAEDLAALGMAFLSACPTLQQAAIGAEMELDEQLTCILKRTSGGTIHAEAGTSFDAIKALSTAMFWDP